MDAALQGRAPKQNESADLSIAKERYWPSQDDRKPVAQISGNQTGIGSIHPLLHQNTSDFSEQKFSSVFTGDEFFLRDHVVRGKPVLPGVAYLEMAYAAINQAAGSEIGQDVRIRLNHTVWVQPVVVDRHSAQVDISLFPEEDGKITFDIYSTQEDGDDPVIIVKAVRSWHLPPKRQSQISLKCHAVAAKERCRLINFTKKAEAEECSMVRPFKELRM